jgi:hypothetical protein
MRLSLLALAVLSPAALAQTPPAPFSLQCSTSMPTTAFKLSLEGDQYLLQVRHLNGVAFMPIHEGVVVPHDFPLLQDKARLLEKMGEYTEFHFPARNCKTYGKGQLSCGDGETKKFGDTEMQALGFSTAKVHESTMGLELDS